MRVETGSPNKAARGSLINLNPRSQLAGASVAGLLAGVLLLASTYPVAAECDGPVPSFRAALASAQRVIVGDVTEVKPSELWDTSVDGRSSRFTLHVRYVLRGEASPVMSIVDLPTQPCAAVVVARVGDRMALAFDALDFEPPIRVNTVAWISGTAPFEGIETITLGETFSLMGLAMPDTSTGPGPDPLRPTVGTFTVALAGFVATLLAAARFRSDRATARGTSSGDIAGR